MATPQEKQHLQALRRRHQETATTWALSRNGTALEAVIVPNVPPVKIAVLTTDCDLDTRDFMLHAHSDIALLLRLLDRAVEFIRRQSQPVPRRKSQTRPSKSGNGDYAAECAMRCAEPDFLTFLREAKGIDTTDAERTAAGIRKALAVQSRGDLNSDDAAARRWHDLKGEFDLWSRT